MTWDLHDYRLVTASAYPGMMAPLTGHPSCVCVMSGDAAPGALSLESLDGVRRRWRFGDVARLADFVPKLLAETPPDERPLLLVPPRSSMAWEAAAAAWPGEVKLAGRPAVVTSRIAEDKIFVREQLAALGVPVPEAVVLPSAEIHFGLTGTRLGVPFVMQSPNGAGGQGTHLILHEAGLLAALREQPHVEKWLLSRFAGSLTINAAGVVHADGVQLLPISVQSSGIAEVGASFGSYCGSDFGAAQQLPYRVTAQALQHAAVVGEWLRGQGHLGLFGADIAVHGDEIAFLEVNPRIQGSSWLLSKLQRESGQDACLEEHVQAILGAPLSTRTGPAAVGTGSHLIVRWTGPAGTIRHVPDGLEGVSGLPALGGTILPGAILARLESPGSLSTPDGHGLRPEARFLLDRLRSDLEIS
ncbi:ATP-grasp domain-containing protein [Catelliglobosispora koreensis]|uniref:ATP-grasp domain-containing protein n=1 Tax=Catelliglobosispora koreensis TaxID=129052 RepID=UPI0003614A5D|nr:ATP-grasp domain-containing protein [Catelliglobosispora koreensis]